MSTYSREGGRDQHIVGAENLAGREIIVGGDGANDVDMSNESTSAEYSPGQGGQSMGNDPTPPTSINTRDPVREEKDVDVDMTEVTPGSANGEISNTVFAPVQIREDVRRIIAAECLAGLNKVQPVLTARYRQRVAVYRRARWLLQRA